MCDEQQLARMGRLNRREFAAMGAIAGLAACAPMDSAQAQQAGLAEQAVKFPTPLGTMDAFFVHPAEGSHPAVIIWPDIAGLRDAFKMMGRRLAEEGFAVLVLNPFYQDAPAPQFADFEDFRENGGFQKVGPWMQKNTPDAVAKTAQAAVSWLDQQAAVDTARGIGTQGYCMGGPFTVRTAAAVPSRVKAAASFHGGGLVGEGPDAPVNLIDDTQASFLFAIAQNDDAKSPGDKDALRKAAEAAGRPATVEVFPGDHGWTVVDSPVYAKEPAERAWTELLELYRRAL
ncbi:dienelactone hydrolase [Altererythrobacter sp. B11]|uniref:dienelactone hydrolase family protein n=1 Tax=Altererythrobacter sp. B11 TaxID=2060312 RepID=UPI000DC7042A|nr:dienelactone hydrolase family protein [Altererythrobacter sp. B11]BBC71104.1 dienelactone hydrolase [Altererythrobacter sp. B11]